MQLRRLSIGAGLAVAALSAAAGTAEVVFVDPDRFVDVGLAPEHREANLKAISTHLGELGRQRLRPDQQLKIEVLDIDLPGQVRPSLRRATEVRVIHADRDWPRIRVRYSLETPGRPVRTGEEWIKDMGYSLRWANQSDPLRLEKRMLTRWFQQRFVNVD